MLKLWMIATNGLIDIHMFNILHKFVRKQKLLKTQLYKQIFFAFMIKYKCLGYAHGRYHKRTLIVLIFVSNPF